MSSGQVYAGPVDPELPRRSIGRVAGVLGALVALEVLMGLIAAQVSWFIVPVLGLGLLAIFMTLAMTSFALRRESVWARFRRHHAIADEEVLRSLTYLRLGVLVPIAIACGTIGSAAVGSQFSGDEMGFASDGDIRVYLLFAAPVFVPVVVLGTLWSSQMTLIFVDRSGFSLVKYRPYRDSAPEVRMIPAADIVDVRAPNALKLYAVTADPYAPNIEFDVNALPVTAPAAAERLNRWLAGTRQAS